MFISRSSLISVTALHFSALDIRPARLLYTTLLSRFEL